jgi:outer membrane protein assembly factor BamC
MKIPFRSTVVFVFALLPITALVGCGTISSIFQGKKPDYQKAGKLQPLEVPPDLTQPGADDRYAVPDAKTAPGTATLSTYNKEKGGQAAGGALATAVQPGLLPSGDRAQVERAGSQRWLLVKAPAEQVWPVVKQYWQDAGYQIKTENATAGVMETEWVEGRQRMPESGIRGILQRALGTNYGTSYRDKFHTRIERTPDGSTEVYISHRRMEEVLEGGSREGTRWEPRPADPEQEAENLSKLLVRFGVDEEKSKTLVAQDTPSRARLSASAEGGGQLVVADPFDRAWRRVGLALDRVGFTVVDRDRSKGTYFVRYIDPQSDSVKEEGFLSKLMFWRSDSKATDGKIQYRIHVTENGGESTIVVENSSGVVEKSATSSRILALLFDQLK